ncbi:MAG: AAC(3) family N-acetyltransferase [Armatimonadota bacterium]
MPRQSMDEMKRERRHVTGEDMARDFAALGLRAGDMVMVHSSLSSIGYVVGAADAVIDALLQVVGERGTVIMPSLVRGGMSTEERFEIWDIEKSPSDVGRITEVFRQRPESIRSWHPTHAVSAIGPLARELTKDHKHASGRPSPWHDAAFAAGSPWEKMCDLGARYMFLGTDYPTCTLFHYIQALFVEVSAAEYERPAPWPLFDFPAMGAAFEERYPAAVGKVGEAETRVFMAADLREFGLAALRDDPAPLFHKRPEDEFMVWHAKRHHRKP